MNKSIKIKDDINCRQFNKKITSIPIENIKIKYQNILSKPSWIKIKIPRNVNYIHNFKTKISKMGLHSVCEEASCPNLMECFNQGKVTFMILGATCTRRCPFCDVKHGRPSKPDANEPENLAQIIADMNLNYVVLTSVNRDDLHDGGAQHFADCINKIRDKNPSIIIEILVPDFRGCMDYALSIINTSLPNIFNHNLESVPRLYNQIRPGANYNRSLNLQKKFKIYNPHLPTKSGLMLGLGETRVEILEVMYDLRLHGVTMLTVGQYLQPSFYHLPVVKYISLQEFEEIRQEALKMGFTHVSCGPFVRSSYHADLQAKGVKIK